MLMENIKINVNNMEIEVSKKTTLLEISKMFNFDSHFKPIIAKVNNRYYELGCEVHDGDSIEFYDLTNKAANKVYVNGLLFLLDYAIHEIFDDKLDIIVKHSIDKGLRIETTTDITKEQVKEIEEKMHIIVKANLPISQVTVLKSEAIDYFNKIGKIRKIRLLDYMTNTYVHLYKMGNLYNYYINKMPCETSCLTDFKLTYLDNNDIILQFPTIYIFDKIKEYTHHPKLFEVFSQEKEWCRLMNVETSSDLNDIVSNGKINELIRMSEMLQDNRLLEVAKEIDSHDKVKIVLIAGPSSSGKTTTCNKLSVYLKSLGLTPKMISMDNFFKNREETPKKENGEYDFECLDALDLKLFNRTLANLLDGKTVKMPTFDFYSGEKKFKSELTLGKKDILLVEGIHALNPKLLVDIDKSHKYKIYISPLTSINIDNDNRMSTTDNRLLRRMIRDNRTRGYNVDQTLSLWDSVREGEEKYVFPYQDEADCVFNTALIYEMCLLKTYVLPLLHSVKSDSENYDEAVRLMKVLDIFLPIPSEAIPADSILREFIGGSCF